MNAWVAHHWHDTRVWVVVWTVLSAFLIHSRIWPTRVCWVCRDKGETAPKESTARRDCWRCKKTRRVRRWLARVPRLVTLLVVAAAAGSILAL